MSRFAASVAVPSLLLALAGAARPAAAADVLARGEGARDMAGGARGTASAQVRLTGMVTSAVVLTVHTEGLASDVARGEGSDLVVGPFDTATAGLPSRRIAGGRELWLAFSLRVQQSGVDCSTVWAHVAPGARLAGPLAVSIGSSPFVPLGPAAAPITGVRATDVVLPGRLTLSVPDAVGPFVTSARVIFEATPTCDAPAPVGL